jgi:hypothetical protein
MQQRFAAGNCDHGCAQRGQLIDAAEHFFGVDGLREIVELVAVGAGQVAATDGDDVSEQWMIGGGECARGHGRSAQVAVEGFGAAAKGCEG